jgi:hypothetical protein
VSLNVEMSPELSLVFPTPILARALFTGAFNERLGRNILKRRRQGEGRRLSGGGWQSASDLLNWPDLDVKLLTAEVLSAVQRINAAPANASGWNPSEGGSVNRNRIPHHGCGWANVNGDGHYNPIRVEAGYQWCAIYHVAIGRPTADRAVMNGKLELLDPRPAAPFANLERFAFGQPLELEPTPGLVVIFPAWLPYCVHPFFGVGHRISITMNITLEEEQLRH